MIGLSPTCDRWNGYASPRVLIARGTWVGINTDAGPLRGRSGVVLTLP